MYEAVPCVTLGGWVQQSRGAAGHLKCTPQVLEHYYIATFSAGILPSSSESRSWSCASIKAVSTGRSGQHANQDVAAPDSRPGPTPVSDS